MNPPTPGHLFLIQRLIETAIEHNVYKAYVILSKSNSDNENPIDCPEKIDVLGKDNTDLDSMIQATKANMISQGGDPDKIHKFIVVPICVADNETSPINTVGRIINEYSTTKKKRPVSETIPGNNGIHLFVIIGEDRQNLVDNLTDIFYKKNDNIHSIDAVILPREDMTTYKGLGKDELMTLDMSSVPVGAFSASFVRNIVAYDLKTKFYDIYRPFMKDESKIETLYQSIKNGLNKVRPNKRTETIKPMKYKYPMVKNHSIDSVQGDKKKRRKTVGGKKKMVSKNKFKTLKRRLKIDKPKN